VGVEEQLQDLVDRGYPQAAGMTEGAFRALAAGLETDDEEAVLVVSTAVVPAEEQVARTALASRTGPRPGFTTMDDLPRWAPVVEVPDAPLWLVHDVDTGAATLSVRPDDALPGILASGRSPLTLEEGLAVVARHPQWLKERNCFEMLGSRAGDKRVTGLWVSGGRPRLGWCWGGNPHTWLGMATCSRRTGPRVPADR
jgi:hypothetical protein